MIKAGGTKNKKKLTQILRVNQCLAAPSSRKVLSYTEERSLTFYPRAISKAMISYSLHSHFKLYATQMMQQSNM